MGQAVSLHITNPLFKFKIPTYNKKYEGSYVKVHLNDEFPIYYIPTNSYGYDLTKVKQFIFKLTETGISIKQNKQFINITNKPELLEFDNLQFKVKASRNKYIKYNHKYNLNFD